MLTVSFSPFFPLVVHNIFSSQCWDLTGKLENRKLANRPSTATYKKELWKQICVTPVIWKHFPLYEEKGRLRGVGVVKVTKLVNVEF